MIGVLALQGCVEAHLCHFRRLGVSAMAVRRPEQLEALEGIVLPGGESTTIEKLICTLGFLEQLEEKAQKVPFWGVCAGAILMSRQNFSWMDFEVERNGYGRQRESFVGTVDCGKKEKGVFIRAPKFIRWGESVTAFGECNGEAVYLGEGQHMAVAFHPELSHSHYFHEIFIKKVRNNGTHFLSS